MTGNIFEVLDQLGMTDVAQALATSGLPAGEIAALTDPDLERIGLSPDQRNRLQRVLQSSAAAKPTRPSHSAPTAERRQLTTLFSDIVGSTQLANSIDPEDLRDVIRGYQRLCSRIITEHGGHVAYAQGDGIMAYFGFPSAREDDPVRAVRAGLELAFEVSALKTVRDVHLRVRIGIATGVVVVGEAEEIASAGSIVVGETPNLAARLQQLAAPGEVLISETTRHLCGATFESESRGTAELKGFSAPVAYYRVLGENSSASRFEAQTRGNFRPIVGREAEVQRLAALWDSARSGRGTAAIICGEAGIGKSRLSQAVLAMARDSGDPHLQWQCSAHLVNRPLHPIVREIETAIGLQKGQSQDGRRSALRAYLQKTRGFGEQGEVVLSDLLDLDRGAPQSGDPQVRARLLFETLVSRVRQLASEKPVLILLEDAHWADSATIDLIGQLIPQIENLPVLLLVTHRPEFVPPWPEDSINGIVLGAIGDDAVAKLIAQVAQGRDLPAGLAQSIVAKAGGIPLFAEELTRNLLDSVGNRELSQEAAKSISIPATLQDSLMERLDRLESAKELAQLGSVIGREFNADMLRMIVPDHPDIEGGLDRLCRSGLAYEQPGFGSSAIVFNHALVQDAAYETLLKKRRREIHRSIAQAMLAGASAFAGAEPETVARHCSIGELDEAAVRHWHLAGHNALNKAAYQPALAHLTNALHDLQGLPEGELKDRLELDVQMALAPAIMSLRGWADPEVERACSRALDLAVAVGDRAAEMGAVWGLWTNSYLRGDLNAGLTVARKVAKLAAADGARLSALEAGHAMSYSHYSRGEFRETLTEVEAGLSRYAREDDVLGLRLFQLSPSAAMLTISSNAHWFLGNDTAADNALAAAHSRAEELDHVGALVHTLCVSSFNLLFREDWDRLQPIAERALRISEAEGFAFWTPMARSYLVLAEQRDVATVGAAVGGFIDVFSGLGYNLTLSQFEPVYAKVLLANGEAALAEERLTRSIASADARAERCYMPEALRMRGEARLVLGNRQAALEDFAAALRLAQEQHAVPLIERARATLSRHELDPSQMN
ncbi:AAA family ATPase [Tabrizicola sp. J26]|uniref:AAA family ATPase n=1 Tax=Alitabrizicola rongguiensis TaxID=2909234 RepID=UPI001F2B86E4|nr:adenylate/guanylate cyclase domain-containing protein [Tabrizicola rongguiensis]MCF1709278.1 AAA family ATPase [Tabrizicola rongguiensis]